MPSRTVRARLDPPSEEGLALLMGEGHNQSEAVRAALVEARRRRRQRSALSDEVSRLARDDADSRERRSVLVEMEAAGTDWPE